MRGAAGLLTIALLAFASPLHAQNTPEPATAEQDASAALFGVYSRYESQALEAMEAGSPAEALIHANAMLAHTRAHFADAPDMMAIALTRVADAQLASGSLVEAIASARQAMAIWDAERGRESTAAVDTMIVLADALAADWHCAESASLAAAAHVAAHESNPGYPPDVRAANVRIACMMLTGQFAEAATLIAATKSDGLIAIGSMHPQMLRLAIGEIRLLSDTGQVEQALRLARQFALDAARLRAEGEPLRASIEALLAHLEADGDVTQAGNQRLLLTTQQTAARLGESHRLVADFQLTLADVLQASGAAADAVVYLEPALRTISALRPDDPLRVAANDAIVRQLYLERRADEAEPVARQNSGLARERLGVLAPLTLRLRLSVAKLDQMAGRLAEAEAEYRALDEVCQSIAPGARERGIISFWLLKAQVENGRCSIAEPALRTEIDRLKGVTGQAYTRADLHVMAADCARERGDMAEAEVQQTAAFDLAEDYSAVAEDASFVFRAATLALMRLTLPDRAASAIQPARVVDAAIGYANGGFEGVSIEQVQQELRDGDRLKIVRTLFLDAAWAAFEAEAPESDSQQLALDALRSIQQASTNAASNALLAGATRRLAAVRDPASGALLDRRDALLAEFATARTTALTQNASVERIDELRTQITQIDDRIRTILPDYFALIAPEPLDAAATMELLADDEAVLHIQPTPFGTHIFLVTDQGGTWQRRDALPQNILDGHVRRLLFDLGAAVDASATEVATWQEQGGGGYPFDRTTAHLLYRELIEPFAEQLAGKRHIFVVSSGSIASLPLGVLVTDVPQGRDGDAAALRATHWLADRYVTVPIPSLQALQLLRRSDRESGKASVDFAGFGDPLLNGGAASRSGGRGVRAPSLSLAGVDELRSLSRLPGTAIELEQLRVALGAGADTVRTGNAATESAIRTADLSNVSVIALATHGLMAGEIGNTTEPGLVFTPPATPQTGDDGLLTMSEIAALRLNSDWVILSACNTAAGDGADGALSGLARAFFLAGADALLASHWPVRDDVAARLTVRTIEIQRADPELSRAEALQRAMREIRNDASHDSIIDSWAHPNAWAPFSLIGDGAR